MPSTSRSPKLSPTTSGRSRVDSGPIADIVGPRRLRLHRAVGCVFFFFFFSISTGGARAGLTSAASAVSLEIA